LSENFGSIYLNKREEGKKWREVEEEKRWKIRGEERLTVIDAAFAILGVV